MEPDLLRVKGGHLAHNIEIFEISKNFDIEDTSETYLIFVNFFTQAKFLESKIYTKKTRKLRQNTQKIANFFALLRQNTQ